jgi:hypothetical protein
MKYLLLSAFALLTSCAGTSNPEQLSKQLSAINDALLAYSKHNIPVADK